MKRSKKPNLSRKGERKNKKVLLIVLFILVIGLIGLVLKKDKILYKEETKYFVGNLYSANHAANMVDYIDNNENIIISPFNINTSLAILYNGTDNNSHKEIKKYFKNNVNTINKEMNDKISSLKEKEIKDNDFTKLYENYIDNLLKKDYDTYTINDINLMTDKEKETLLLLLKRIDLTYNRIYKKNNLSLKSIKKYNLNKNDITYNAYSIKTLIDNRIDDYESYKIQNKITNYNELYISSEIKEKEIEEEFTNNLKNYNSKISLINISNLQSATKKINVKIKEVTNEKIKRVVEQKDIKDKELIMINNLSFNYEWETSFKKNNVTSEEFFGINDTINIVEMMHSTEEKYLENEYAKGFIKNFEDNKYSFVGILPNQTENFELSSLNIDSLLSSEKNEKVEIGIPKFNYNTEIDMKKLLENYGIKEIFTNQANFSKITNQNIDDISIIQKSYITIAERGTEKTTISSSSIENYAIDESNKQIILNRPFAYLIMNNETKEILLIGKVVMINEGN